jgi:tetratricopeptide (TPR) repeat protein
MKNIFPDETNIKKEQELNRLMARAESVSENEINLLGTVYEQIARILIDLKRYNEAIENYLKLENILIIKNDTFSLGRIYNDIGLAYAHKRDFSKSLEYYHKSEEVLIKDGNEIALGTTYNNLGGVFSETGDWDTALNYYLKAEQSFIKSKYDEGLGATYNNIGGYYIFKEDWEKSLEFLLRSENIRSKIQDNDGLGITYFNIGFVYSKLNFWEEALKYLNNSERILLDIGDSKKRRELQKLVGTVYNGLGIAYSNKGDFDNSISFHHKAENIRYSIDDFSGLVQTLYNIGMEWLRIKNSEKAINYFILAGYIAKKNEMTFELQQMDWAIKEIIRKHGEANFMELGESHYNSWLQHAKIEKAQNESN